MERRLSAFERDECAGNERGMRERSGTKREMKSARYLYVVYPGFLYSFSDLLTISEL